MKDCVTTDILNITKVYIGQMIENVRTRDTGDISIDRSMFQSTIKIITKDFKRKPE